MPKLSYLETHLTDHCNLNCAGCSHFSPILKPYFIEFDSFRKDLARLKELFSNIKTIRLLGGEPLLHPQIIELLIVARSFFSTSNIFVVTNGTLLKNQKQSFWKCLKDNKIRLSVTLYRKTFVLEKLIIKTCNENDIEYEIVKTFSFLKYINIDGNSDKDIAFKNCISKNCFMLRNGKIAVCGGPFYIGKQLNDFFKKSIFPEESDIIDIYEINMTGDKIIDRLNNSISLCKWCNEKSYYAKWNLSTYNLKEWIAKPNFVNSLLPLRKIKIKRNFKYD